MIWLLDVCLESILVGIEFGMEKKQSKNKIIWFLIKFLELFLMCDVYTRINDILQHIHIITYFVCLFVTLLATEW